MRIQSSHLALRFYKHDGWDEETLKSCLSYGDIDFCPGEYLNYWRLTIGSGFDVPKIMKHATLVDRWSIGGVIQTDEDYIRSMNW